MKTTIKDFITLIKQQKWYKDQIAHIETISSRKPVYGELGKSLPSIIQNYLDKKGIRLYSHQATAINKVRQGKNVILSTATASGKTLAFNIPVLEALLNDKAATALYLYPTKALSNDQLKILADLEMDLRIPISPNVYDGDTPQHARQKIRDISRIILSNPYGIHQYLPWHYKWNRFFKNLKFIIIDEAHAYRGVFGSNVAMLIRRILRICEYYGSNPQFFLSSATIANPEEHSKNLTGKDFEVVSNDGSISGGKFFIFWNPPFIGHDIRRSTHQETKDLFAFHVKNELQTLCFTISRQMAELIAKWTGEELKSDSVASYRAGYLPEERREIERKLRERELLGVASTNALELGIDIGSLDAIIISGYPGTIISTWQQAGRAGRGAKATLVTMVAFEEPLNQYFMRHPDEFFGKPHEHAIVDLRNPYILAGHLVCASAELPVNEEDKKYFGTFNDEFEELKRRGLIRRTPKGWVWAGTARPVDIVKLNNISDKIVTVLCDNKVFETMDLSQAYSEAYKGAVLLHQGETYIVEAIDLENLIAKVKQKDVSYYTEPRKTADIRILNTYEKRQTGTEVSVGEVEVTEYYHSYVLKTYDRIITRKSLDLPPLKFKTTGIWFTIPEKIHHAIVRQSLDFAGGIHAAEHAMIAMIPIYAMCDKRDVGGVSTPRHPNTRKPTIFIYDGFEHGIGISEKVYELFEKVVEVTIRLIRDCECKEGCPSCIYSPQCGNENRPLDKQAAIYILDKIRG
jgi:DEAD/DEAH box helicase domain-containing protein